MSNDIVGAWNEDTGAFVLRYRGQTLEFPKNELAALTSAEHAVAYIESRLEVFKKLIDANTKLYFPCTKAPIRSNQDLIDDIVTEVKQAGYRFKDEPHKPDYRKVFK